LLIRIFNRKKNIINAIVILAVFLLLSCFLHYDGIIQAPVKLRLVPDFLICPAKKT